jgi:lipoic acid synthetase
MANRTLNGFYLKKISCGNAFGAVSSTLKELGLNTVCQEARCPNRSECYSSGTATFLIMGPICTRNCSYCSVERGVPVPLDETEPERIAEAVRRLKLNYVVITSTTRDDLSDGGLRHFIKTVVAIKRINPQAEIEVLVPDFGGNWQQLEKLFEAGISVFNHNIEVVRALFPICRPRGNYLLSLELLKKAAGIGNKYGVLIKSGLMVGLGESFTQIEETLVDLKNCGVDIVTIGQYLRPTRFHPEPARVYNESDYLKLKEIAGKIGFRKVAIGPFVRSSYRADETRKGV